MRLPLTLPPASERRFDAVGFGLNSVDYLVVVEPFPRPGSKQRLRQLARQAGGQAASAMAACARLGWRARYVGVFGGDENGAHGRESLERAGVDTTACRTLAGRSNQFAVILVEAGTGERTVMWDRDPALVVDPAEVPLDAVTSGRVLLVDCSYTPAATVAARAARAAGVPTVIDVEHRRPGIEELLREIDVIIAAREFPHALTGQVDLGRALRALADEFRPALACVTLGKEGALALAGGREFRVPAFAVPVVDTTGAGDAFRGGFVAGWLGSGPEADIEMLLAYANAVAGLKCRALGAREGLPTRPEVEALLGSRQPG